VEPAAGPVTDDERNRFGVLLDHAAERGLLSAAEYQLRLRGLAEATSLEEMTTIVSELPSLAPSSRGAGQPGAVPDLAALGVRQAQERRRTSPWAMLAILLVVVVAALVFLAVYAEHTLHDRTGSGQSPQATLSAPRL